jgi:hypothetical protein
MVSWREINEAIARCRRSGNILCRVSRLCWRQTGTVTSQREAEFRSATPEKKERPSVMPAALDLGLQPGDEVKCPTCRQRHVVQVSLRQSGHPYADAMLYFTCRGGEHFAGPKLERRGGGGNALSRS